MWELNRFVNTILLVLDIRIGVDIFKREDCLVKIDSIELEGWID